jgi:hypothetical protein
MNIPFHTQHCREGYGCASLCPVLLLATEHQTLQKDIAKIEASREYWMKRSIALEKDNG